MGSSHSSVAETVNVYHGLKLDEIRLLQFLNGTQGQLFSCQLTCHALNALPAYSALSYTWRDTTISPDNHGFTGHIYLNGIRFAISENLENALRYLRTTLTESDFFWIDAICINQSDTTDRCIQVRIMDKIYSCAEKVIVWLGASADRSDVAVEFLETLANKQTSKGRVDWVEARARNPAFFLEWMALQRLLTRLWWQRTWIIQEYVLGSKVIFVCGNRVLDSKSLEAANALLFEAWGKIMASGAPQRLGWNARNLDPLRNLCELKRTHRSDEGVGILPCLVLTREAGATDPRDLLYSKYGLMADYAANLCPVDYTISLHGMSKTFAKNYIEQTGDLYIVCHAGMPCREHCRVTTLPAWSPRWVQENFFLQALPSWVPLWGKTRPTYPLRCSWTGRQTDWPRYNAAGGSVSCVEFLRDDKVLRSRAIIIDEMVVSLQV
jgi:hypothetical protein